MTASASTVFCVALLLAALAAVQAQKCKPTAKDILGPYYQPGAPLRNNTVCPYSPAEDMLVLRGTVYSASDCTTPLPYTLLDVWQANPKGQYSEGNSKGSDDFTCRSLLETDDNGNLLIKTLMPGRYDDGGYRPAHIHFKITPYNSSVTLTTQLYFLYDKYRYPQDSCGGCNSKDPTLVATVAHNNDIKTYEGKWNIYVYTSADEQALHDSVPSGGSSLLVAGAVGGGKMEDHFHDEDHHDSSKDKNYTERKEHIMPSSTKAKLN